MCHSPLSPTPSHPHYTPRSHITSYTTHTYTHSLLLAETIHAAGLPKGIFGLLLGDGSTGSALVGHPAVDMVSFTGKEHTGKSVAALAVDGMKRLHLEMGGKASNILLMPDMHDTDTPGTDTSTYNNDDASASTSGNTSDSTGGTTSAIASSTKSTNTSTNTIGNSTSLGLSFQGQFPIPLGGREKLVQESLQNLKETLLSVLANSGQNCTAATNLLVPRAYMSQAEDTAAVLFGSTVFTNYAGSSGSGYASGSPPYLTLVSSPTSPNRNKKDIFNFLAGESESECKEAAPVHVHKHVHSVDKSVEDGDLRSRTTNSVCMGMGMEIGPLGSQEQYQRCQVCLRFKSLYFYTNGILFKLVFFYHTLSYHYIAYNHYTDIFPYLNIYI